MSKLGLFTDTASDLPDKLIEKHSINFIPLIIIFPDENKEYKHKIELGEEEYYKKIANAKIHPSTSQANGSDVLNMLKKLEEQGFDEAFYVSIGSGISSNVNTVHTHKKMYERKGGKVKFVIYDSKQASMGIGLLTLKANNLIKQGLSSDEIAKKLDEFRDKEMKVTFTVESLKYLLKGGRISRMKYTIANILDIHPCMEVSEQGTLEIFDKARSYEDAIEKIIDHAYSSFDNKENLACYIVEGRAEKGVKHAREILKNKYPDVKVYGDVPLGAVIFTHSGPGTIEIAMFKDFEH
ncbi:MAG: DegV family protein [Candidatus Heimdallarchaeaceae archaeon]